MLAAALLVSGCDILTKLGITPGDDDGEDKPADSVPVAFENITVDKSATTTSLALVFDRDIPGLESGDITLTPETPELAGITVAGLTGDGAGTYILALSGVDKPDGDEPGQTGALGAVAVGVSKGGYAVSPASRPTLVYYVDPIIDAAVGITPDGAADTTVTTSLTLTFNPPVPGLDAVKNITLDPGTTGAKKGALLGNGQTYTLGISGIEEAGEIAVGVSKSGYSISPVSQTARVHYPAAVFQSVTANGATGTATTTTLTLTFDKDIDGLVSGDITITAGSTGTTQGTLNRIATGTYKLDVSGVKAAGEITVGVSKSGYSISSASQTVRIYGKGLPVAGQESNPSIKEKFGVTALETAGVTGAFNALHEFIQAGGLASGTVKLGDWIDLEGGLAVEAYDGTDNKGGGGFNHNATKAVEKVYNKGAAWGTLCRLIVVGVNSFNGKNDNDTPHVVFQFQNIPVTRRMNATNTNEGGYAESEMRTYLTGNFLAGLKIAGVPDGVLWAPVRYLSAGTNGKGATKITDKLWLPTKREMTGSGTYSADGETVDNQARLAYYTDNNTRLKAWDGDSSDNYPDMKKGTGEWYWTGSARYDRSDLFCNVHDNGSDTASYSASSAGGVAPAFCVK